MSEVSIITKVVDGAIAFAMAHPVAATIIAVAGIVGYVVIQKSNNNSNNQNDEDRNVGNRNGKIRQS